MTRKDDEECEGDGSGLRRVNRTDLVTTLLESSDDLTDESSLDTVRLEMEHDHAGGA